MLASAGASDARPTLQLNMNYNPAVTERLSKQITAAQLRAMAAPPPSPENKATHPSERGVVGNLFSAAMDSTVASGFYGTTEGLLRAMDLRTLANIVSEGRVRNERSAQETLTYAREVQDATVDWDQVTSAQWGWTELSGPTRLAEYMGWLGVRSSVSIAAAAAGSLLMPGFGVSSAMGQLGLRALGAFLPLYPQSLGSILDAQRAYGSTEFLSASILAVPHAAASIVGPVAAASGVMKAAGYAGLPMPTTYPGAMLLTGIGGGVSEVSQAGIERSGVARGGEEFFSARFIDELWKRSRDGLLLFPVGALGRRNPVPARYHFATQLEPFGAEGTFSKVYWKDAQRNSLLLVARDRVDPWPPGWSFSPKTITDTQAAAAMDLRLFLQNQLAQAVPGQIVSPLKRVADGVLEIEPSRGITFQNLPGATAKGNAIRNHSELVRAAKNVLGFDAHSYYSYGLVKSGPIKNWAFGIDADVKNMKNMHFDEHGRITRWFDPIRVVPMSTIHWPISPTASIGYDGYLSGVHRWFDVQPIKK